eukprot:gene17888-33444_t
MAAVRRTGPLRGPAIMMVLQTIPRRSRRRQSHRALYQWDVHRLRLAEADPLQPPLRGRM